MGGGLKSLLSKMALRRATGVYLDEGSVSISRVAVTPLGPVEISNTTYVAPGWPDYSRLTPIGTPGPGEPDGFGLALEDILTHKTRKGKPQRNPVSLGIPMMPVVLVSRRSQPTDRETTPIAMLHEVLRSSNLNVDELEVDLLLAQPAGRALTILVACRRRYLSSLLSMTPDWGGRLQRVEPAPFALVRLAASRHRAPRGTKTPARVFLGHDGGVAVHVCGDVPLAWRPLELPAGDEAAAIGATFKAMRTLSKLRGDVPTPDAPMLHGRPDLADALADPAFLADLGVPCRHVPDPAYDRASVALGLALGCQGAEGGFDLARRMKPRPSFREIFPYAEVVLQSALLFCVTLFLASKDDSTRRAHRQIRAETARHAWLAKVSDDKLEKEKKDLGQKVEAVRDYLGSRILWTAYTQDASAKLPEGVVLRSFHGLSEMDTGAKKGRSKKSLVMKLTAPVQKGRSVPNEIDAYLEELRRDPLLRRDFPEIKISGLQWNQKGPAGGDGTTEFTITCMPKIEKPQAKRGRRGRRQTLVRVAYGSSS